MSEKMSTLLDQMKDDIRTKELIRMLVEKGFNYDQIVAVICAVTALDICLPPKITMTPEKPENSAFYGR